MRCNDSSRFTWTLIGLAVRIGHALGLHRDVTNLSLKPFDKEMRRRLWWQLCVLDAQASNDRASDPVILVGTFDTPFPLNIDDEDLKFGQVNELQERQGITSMTHCLVTFELSKTLREVMYVPPSISKRSSEELDHDGDQKIALIHRTQKHIEQTYLQADDPSGRFLLVARKTVDLCVGLMWLVACRPLRRLPSSNRTSKAERMHIFDMSIKVLELSIELDDVPIMKWLSATYVQWHALAVALTELCVLPDSAHTRRAWSAVDTLFERSSDRVADSMNGLLWRPIRKLMAKAQNNRRSVTAVSRPASTTTGKTHAASVITGIPLQVLPEVPLQPSLGQEVISYDDFASDFDPRITLESHSSAEGWQDWNIHATKTPPEDLSGAPLSPWADWETFIEEFVWEANYI